MTADSDRVAALAQQVLAEHDPNTVPIPEYLGACYDAGLCWVHFPDGMGGLGVSRGLQAVADKVVRACRQGKVLTVEGDDIDIGFESVCIHSDTPGAPELLQAVRRALEENGIRILPVSQNGKA